MLGGLRTHWDMKINYGLILDEPSEKDYGFLGGFLPYEVLVEDGDWTPYLPEKELQAEKYETWACVTFTVLNCLETLIKRKYDEDVNFSDRFLAVISETKDGGNTPRKVLDSLRKKGVVSEDVYPFPETFKEFYADIPDKVIDLAKEFTEDWEFKYENVPNEQVSKALKSSPLFVSVPAWFQENGLYYRPKGKKDNHAATLIKITPEYKRVFDTYKASIKSLDRDMKHSVIKRFSVKKRVKKTFWLLAILRRLLT